VTRAVTSRAPTRIDLGGGWTDVPPYCDREGGFVCNVAITRYAEARVALDAGKIDGAQDPLVRAIMKRAGASSALVRLSSDFPVGAGLGGSSAASAALLWSLSALKGTSVTRSDVAEEGRRVEVEEMGIAGGRQDHYAATHGGALALTFTTATEVRRISVSARTLDELAARSILIYTGQSRISGDTITAVLGAYERGESRVVRSLQRMKELALDMARALERDDLDSLGALLGEHWTHQRALHPSIPTARIDEIVARAGAEGALGAKAMGASGGGCVLIIARPDRIAGVRHAVSGLGELLDFKVDTQGVAVVNGATQ
jgi:D-glycero-alpha-D-manno-heptose-7-phosphate kinase